MISTSAIHSIADKLKTETIRNTTRRSYYSAWRTFNEFFVRLDSKPDNWEDRIILFVGYLIELKRKSTTILSYISAIKKVLRDDGVILSEDRFLINSLTKACRLTNDMVKTRLPLQRKLLELIMQTLDDHLQGQPYLLSLYKALFSTAYYGLFRVGELTSGDHPVKVTDVHIADNKRKFFFVLRTSKTHWKNSPPQIIKISYSGSNQLEHITKNTVYCPYYLLKEYLDIRPKFLLLDEQFFVFSDYSKVKASHFRSTLKTAIQLSGLDPKVYDTHSLRIGHAVDLRHFQISVETIRKLGRWKSSMVYTYLKW